MVKDVENDYEAHTIFWDQDEELCNVTPKGYYDCNRHEVTDLFFGACLDCNHDDNNERSKACVECDHFDRETNSTTTHHYRKRPHRQLTTLGMINYPLLAIFSLAQFYSIFLMVAKTRAVNHIRGTCQTDLVKSLFFTYCTINQVANEHEIFSDSVL